MRTHDTMLQSICKDCGTLFRKRVFLDRRLIGDTFLLTDVKRFRCCCGTGEWRMDEDEAYGDPHRGGDSGFVCVMY